MRVRREDYYHSHVCTVNNSPPLFNHTLITSCFTLQVTAAVFSSCLFLLISHVFLILSFHATLSSQESHKENLCIPSQDTNSNISSRDGDNYRSENRSCHLQTDHRRSTWAAPLRRFKHGARQPLLTSKTRDKQFKRLWQETLPPGCD